MMVSDMFVFAEATKDMTAAETLNYYRNLYYAEPQVTERGIVANAINDYFREAAPRAEVAREIFEEIEREITDALKSNYKVLPLIEESEALWNNVNGKINALRGIEYFIEELKKKYTGESP